MRVHPKPKWLKSCPHQVREEKWQASWWLSRARSTAREIGFPQAGSGSTGNPPQPQCRQSKREKWKRLTSQKPRHWSEDWPGDQGERVKGQRRTTEAKEAVQTTRPPTILRRPVFGVMWPQKRVRAAIQLHENIYSRDCNWIIMEMLSNQINRESKST